MKFIIVYFLLHLVHISVANATEIQHLQQRASSAYELMMQTKDRAETSSREATRAENRLQRTKQELVKAEQEAKTTKKKSEESNLVFKQAEQNWNQASDTLAEKWDKSIRK